MQCCSVASNIHPFLEKAGFDHFDVDHNGKIGGDELRPLTYSVDRFHVVKMGTCDTALALPRQGLRFSGSNSTEDIIDEALKAADAPWLCSLECELGLQIPSAKVDHDSMLTPKE